MHPGLASSPRVFLGAVTILISWCLVSCHTSWAVSFELPEVTLVGNETIPTSGIFEVMVKASPWELSLDVTAFNLDLMINSPLVQLGPATPPTANALLGGGNFSDFSPDSQTVRVVHIIADAVPLADNKVLAQIPFEIAVGQEGIFDLTFGPFNAVSDAAGQLLVPNTSAGGFIKVAFPVVGDYNNDGMWNAGDYTVWRESFGDTGFSLPADGTGPGLDGLPDGIVDQHDYAYWKLNFGLPSLPPSTSSSGNIPEPGSLLLLLMVPFLMPARCRNLPGE